MVYSCFADWTGQGADGLGLVGTGQDGGIICGGVQQRVEDTQCAIVAWPRASLVNCSGRCHDHTAIGTSRFYIDAQCAPIVHGRARSRSTSRRWCYLSHVSRLLRVVASRLCWCPSNGGRRLKMGEGAIMGPKTIELRSWPLQVFGSCLSCAQRNAAEVIAREFIPWCQQH